MSPAPAWLHDLGVTVNESSTSMVTHPGQSPCCSPSTGPQQSQSPLFPAFLLQNSSCLSINHPLLTGALLRTACLHNVCNHGRLHTCMHTQTADTTHMSPTNSAGHSTNTFPSIFAFTIPQTLNLLQWAHFQAIPPPQICPHPSIPQTAHGSKCMLRTCQNTSLPPSTHLGVGQEGVLTEVNVGAEIGVVGVSALGHWPVQLQHMVQGALEGQGEGRAGNVACSPPVRREGNLARSPPVRRNGNMACSPPVRRNGNVACSPPARIIALTRPAHILLCMASRRQEHHS